jgi:hypothetical protein
MDHGGDVHYDDHHKDGKISIVYSEESKEDTDPPKLKPN